MNTPQVIMGSEMTLLVKDFPLLNNTIQLNTLLNTHMYQGPLIRRKQNMAHDAILAFQKKNNKHKKLNIYFKLEAKRFMLSISVQQIERRHF